MVGTKAANLLRLFQDGIPVPCGFCITVEALRTYDASSPEQDTKEIHSLDIPARIREEILAAYRDLTKASGIANKVAVRSSGVSEDLAQASFAGQYDTGLNIENEEQLIRAIKKVWVSSFSMRAEMYRKSKGGTHRPRQMAVIVQLMVNPEVAGVLFTRDPVAQEKEQMLVEYNRGLGDAVVAGTRVANQIRVRRDNFEITDTLDLDPQWDGVMKNRFRWEDLLKMSLRIEEIFKCPQDIEWAYDGQKFWILQSRPISTEKRRPSRQLWSRANAGEILPGVVTPLTWSIFKPMLQAAGRYIGRSLLTLQWNWHHPYGEFADSPRLFNGRAYMELISVYPGFGRFPGITPLLLEKVLGFEYHVCADDEIPKRTPRRHPVSVLRIVVYWLEVLNITHRLASGARKWTTKPLPGSAKPASQEIPNPSDVVREIDDLLKETSRVLAWHIQCTSVAFSSFGLLEGLVKKYLGEDEYQRFGTGLIVDFRNISTVKQSISIWDLSEALRKSPAAMKALYEAKDPGEFFSAVSADLGSGGFMELWKAFLLEFGERSSQEFELSVPHWDEDCSFILETLRTVLKGDVADPRQRLAHQLNLGSQHRNEIKALLKKEASAIERWLFNRLITTYSICVPLRENLKYCVVARFNSIRKRMLVLGAQMREMGMVSEVDDIFYLSYEEINHAVRNDFSLAGQILAHVESRKKEYEFYRRCPLADLLIIAEGRVMPLQLKRDGPRSVLQGIGCSNGQCVGIAYVLDSVVGLVSVPPGCIIIAPSIDPGLTPLFLTAAGLVTEIGGVLSHGATVARELGVPAVVGVPKATELIKNGQRIAVDGTAGKVYLLESEDQAQR